MENQLVQIFHESVVDVTLYLIMDELPATVVKDIHRTMDNIDGIKNFFDFRAYIMIEFVSKKKADAAREAGFTYLYNNQRAVKKYASLSRVMYYAREIIPANIGNGF